MKRPHEAIAGTAPKQQQQQPLALSFTHPISPATTAAAPDLRYPSDEAQSSSGSSRPEALVAADQWLTRQQALRWLSTNDEMAYLNAVAQQQMYLSTPSTTTSGPSALDYFGSPAGVSVASPMSSVPATPVMPVTAPEDVDCAQVHGDHSLEFEIQRDMGMVWREIQKDGRCGPPPPACSPPYLRHGVDPGSPAVCSDTPRHAYAAYPSPEWSGALFHGAHHDGHIPSSVPHNMHYGPPITTTPHYPVRHPVYTHSDWSGHVLPPPGPQRRHTDITPQRGHYDPYM